MAQYGRNYYGASYYGLSGVFAGQFLSDPTDLSNPLSNTAPYDGKLYLDLICNHPRITYVYPNDIFIRTGNWTGNTSSDPAFVMQANLVSSTLVLNYVSRVDGANIDINVKTYVAGGLVGDNTYHVDTMGAGPYVIQPPQFGEQIVKITKSASSGAPEIFEFVSLEAMTTDISLEMKAKAGDGSWSNWASVALTPTESNVSFNGYNNVYKYTATTPVWTGKTGYQFKLMMASSDNLNSPEVLSTDVHTASTGEFSPDGYWKMTLNLEPGILTIDTITFNVEEPEGTSVKIRSRTSDIDGNWSTWSLPYSASQYRAILNYKANVDANKGYIMTPIVSPECLTFWQDFELKHLLNYYDTLSGATTAGAKMTVDVVTANHNPKDRPLEDILMTFSYSSDEQLTRDISAVPKNTPLRFKINFEKPKNGVASPAVEQLDTFSLAYYREIQEFGTGVDQLHGYGSAVYGDNTGIDRIYSDGLGRTSGVTISNLNFTIPVGAENPEYVIEVDPTFAETYTAEEVDIYWNSNGTKGVYLENGLVNDYPMVRVREAREKRRISKHYRYGSGIVLDLDPAYTAVSLTNTFSPALTTGITYAYYVQNGFVLGEPNDHLDIRWAQENSILQAQRRGIAYTLNDQIYISIVSGSTNGLVAWVSEEKKFEGTVNMEDKGKKYVAVLTASDNELPEIAPGIVVDPHADTIPYVVEVIEGSVTSHGERKPEKRLLGKIRYLAFTEDSPSLKTTVEEKAEVIRGPGDIDSLPKAMVRNITAVYSQANQYSPYYFNDSDYQYSIPGGGIYSNEINWSLGKVAGTAPSAGSSYYVTYTYDKVVSLLVEFECVFDAQNDTRPYYEYEPNPQIYRSSALQYSGECSPMFDYVSPPISVDDFTIDPGVDKSTLRFVVYDDNPRVRTYLDGNKVIGTLDKRDPRESWNPYVSGGYYYVGRDGYYMFINENEYSLGDGLIPIAENISYVESVNGTGVRIEEETTNLVLNPKLQRSSTRKSVFFDLFERGT